MHYELRALLAVARIEAGALERDVVFVTEFDGKNVLATGVDGLGNILNPIRGELSNKILKRNKLEVVGKSCVKA
ncbi:hypothetical protein CEXT_459161 [Caerostris extrusa]|uniref:Uncharacterized protein n=1 Tax=Caerostris extrusa TaxID=172846 RepID=A0AAV4Q9K4_CAEEX|nr:hypothetical protein CEXT_459161 [Caerostris extrusa]